MSLHTATFEEDKFQAPSDFVVGGQLGENVSESSGEPQDPDYDLFMEDALDEAHLASADTELIGNNLVVAEPALVDSTPRRGGQQSKHLSIGGAPKAGQKSLILQGRSQLQQNSFRLESSAYKDSSP